MVTLNKLLNSNPAISPHTPVLSTGCKPMLGDHGQCSLGVVGPRVQKERHKDPNTSSRAVVVQHAVRLAGLQPKATTNSEGSCCRILNGISAAGRGPTHTLDCAGQRRHTADGICISIYPYLYMYICVYAPKSYMLPYTPFLGFECMGSCRISISSSSRHPLQPPPFRTLNPRVLFSLPRYSVEDSSGQLGCYRAQGSCKGDYSFSCSPDGLRWYSLTF